MTVTNRRELINEILDLRREKGIKNLSQILNDRYSLPYLEWLNFNQLLDLKEWLKNQ